MMHDYISLNWNEIQGKSKRLSFIEPWFKYNFSKHGTDVWKSKMNPIVKELKMENRNEGEKR